MPPARSRPTAHVFGNFLEIQDWINDLLKNKKKLSYPSNGVWQYMVQPDVDPIIPIMREFLLKDHDLGQKDIGTFYKKKYEEFHADGTYKFAQTEEEKTKTGENSPLTFEGYFSKITQLFRYTHNLGPAPKGRNSSEATNIIINPKNDPYYANMSKAQREKLNFDTAARWAWMLDFDRMQEAFEMRKRDISNPNKIASGIAGYRSAHVRILRDFIATPQALAVAGKFEEAQRKVTEAMADEIKEQKATESDMKNLPLPHEMLMNKARHHYRAKNLAPILSEARAMLDSKKLKQTAYDAIHNTVFSNLYYQLVDHSDGVVFRNQNFYLTKILIKGKDPEPKRGLNVDYVMIDPRDRKDKLEFVFYSFKTDKYYEDFKYTHEMYKGTPYYNKTFKEIGYRVIVEANTLAHQAFWWTWDLVPDRQFMFVQARSKKEMTSQYMSNFVNKQVWLLDDTKEPTATAYRTSKQNIQKLNAVYLNAKEKEVQFLNAFQSATGAARMNYELPELVGDYANSYRLANAFPDETKGGKLWTLMHTNPNDKKFGQFRNGERETIEGVLNGIDKVYTRKGDSAFDLTSRYKAPLITAASFPNVFPEGGVDTVDEEMFGDADEDGLPDASTSTKQAPVARSKRKAVEPEPEPRPSKVRVGSKRKEADKQQPKRGRKKHKEPTPEPEEEDEDMTEEPEEDPAPEYDPPDLDTMEGVEEANQEYEPIQDDQVYAVPITTIEKGLLQTLREVASEEWARDNLAPHFVKITPRQWEEQQESKFGVKIYPRNKEAVEFYMKIIPDRKALEKMREYKNEMKKLDEAGGDSLFEEMPDWMLRYEVAFPVYKKLLYNKDGKWYAAERYIPDLIEGREKRRRALQKISWLKDQAPRLLAVIEAAERRGDTSIPRFPANLTEVDLPEYEYANVLRFRRTKGRGAPGAGRPKGAKTLNRNKERSADKMRARAQDKKERQKHRMQMNLQPYPENRRPARIPRRGKPREEYFARRNARIAAGLNPDSDMEE